MYISVVVRMNDFPSDRDVAIDVPIPRTRTYDLAEEKLDFPRGAACFANSPPLKIIEVEKSREEIAKMAGEATRRAVERLYRQTLMATEIGSHERFSMCW